MKAFETYFPTKLVFGAGEIRRLGEFAKQYGKKAMIVTTGPDMKNFGILDCAIAALEDAGVAWEIFDGIEPNPKDYNVDAGVSAFLQTKCHMAIGLGGGSAMDGAKAIAMVAKNGGSISDYMPSHARYTEQLTQTYPVLCVTTTSGTGSEATYFSVVTNTQTHEKPGLGCPCMMPVVSIIDPELMVSLPNGITAQTGVDVFFHAMEAYLSTVSTPYTDMIALEAMRLVKENLPKVLKIPMDIEARGKMAWANTLGGMAIVLAATCGLHAMGHSISGVTDAAHGRALAAAAVPFLAYTCDSDVKRYADVARILGASSSESDEDAAQKCAPLMKTFLEESGMQTSIGAIGVTENQLEMIADVACSSMAFCLKVTLKPLNHADVMKILRKALN